jgi:hypothetical protein
MQQEAHSAPEICWARDKQEEGKKEIRMAEYM